MNSQSTCLRFPSIILEFQAYAIIFKNPSTNYVFKNALCPWLPFLHGSPNHLAYCLLLFPGGYMNLMRTKPVFEDCSVTGWFLFSQRKEFSHRWFQQKFSPNKIRSIPSGETSMGGSKGEEQHKLS